MIAAAPANIPSLLLKYLMAITTLWKARRELNWKTPIRYHQTAKVYGYGSGKKEKHGRDSGIQTRMKTGYYIDRYPEQMGESNLSGTPGADMNIEPLSLKAGGEGKQPGI